MNIAEKNHNKSINAARLKISEWHMEHWYHTAEDANWKNFAEMKADFGSVDSVGNQHYVFNIGGSKYRSILNTRHL